MLFGELEQGDVFEYFGQLYIKTNRYTSIAEGNRIRAIAVSNNNYSDIVREPGTKVTFDDSCSEVLLIGNINDVDFTKVFSKSANKVDTQKIENQKIEVDFDSQYQLLETLKHLRDTTELDISYHIQKAINAVLEDLGLIEVNNDN